MTSFFFNYFTQNQAFQENKNKIMQMKECGLVILIYIRWK